MRKCYVCGRPLNDEQADELFLEDDDHRGVPVGSDCKRKAIKAGADGIQSRGGGPRVFFLPAHAVLYRQARQ